MNSHANVGIYAGTITDSFRLVGGPLAYSSAFTADVEDDLVGTHFVLVPTSITGDPFTCDPL